MRTRRAGNRVLGVLAVACAAAWAAAPVEAPLPDGVVAVWDLTKAYRQTTPTRERICLNGLWRWQPAREITNAPPGDGWGFFKVPGCWPGITDYLQKDFQKVHAHPDWQDENLGRLTAAWHQREIAIPSNWSGRRITLETDYLNSFAVVFVNERRVGEMRFPAGAVDLTGVCRPGVRYRLSLLVVALPLKGVMLSFTDTAAAREVKGAVARRGLCGDVWLVGTPHGPRLDEVRVATSVRNGEITVDAALRELEADRPHALRARITENDRAIKEFTSAPFRVTDLDAGRFMCRERWKPDKLWDLHTPQNLYQIEVALLDAGGRVLDAAHPVRFGFREFWIEGRDFFLNGTRLFLSAVPLDNAQVGVWPAGYAAARESLKRLQSFGINFTYTHNYGCEPGAHLSFEEILRAADEIGMLVALSQPHFSHYDWKGPNADQTNGYAHHAAFYARVAGNHPSVVAYSTSHNATGYAEDMNPDLMDGLADPRETWSRNNARLALRAEAIIRRLDPWRLVYHHASGNLGAMHTSNFYPNWAPIQELDDWFEHWATHGVKPVFLCEYGAPFGWDWTLYRGWYKGARSFGSAAVPWDYCLAEWNAQFLGDAAFQISEREKANLRWEAGQYQRGAVWHRWDYPTPVGDVRFEEMQPVQAAYTTANWRAFRTWGVSATSPWEHHRFWKLRENVDRTRKELRTDWEHLQRPGFSADFIGPQYERMDLAYEPSDWLPTPTAQSLLRNNRPLLAWIAGQPARFTSKDHNFLPGEVVEKQLIVINNSRETVAADCAWSLALPRAMSGRARLTVPTGEQRRIPLRFDLPASLPAGRYALRASVAFGTGETQDDAFTLHVLPSPPAPTAPAKLAVFDPKGETRATLDALGIRYEAMDARADLAGHDALVIGKGALTVDGPGPDLRRVRDGLKVVVFEQTAEVLEQRLGFRVAEYGLRQVFRRVPDHPLLRGLEPEHLRDWRGEATLLPPRLRYTLSPRLNYVPVVQWCGLEVPRLWRCGNRGNVASVLIEKPARGDFLPIVDGGFSLQYSPLLEYREGQGGVLFCQMDVTGRSEGEPAAEWLVRNVLGWLADRSGRSDQSDQSDRGARPPRRQARYVGDPAGRRYLERAGVAVAPYQARDLPARALLIVGPGGGKELADSAAAVAAFLKAGGCVLVLGLDEPEANAFLPFPVRMTTAEHIASLFDPPGVDSVLAGIGPADVHNRDPRAVPLVTAGATVIGDGVLAVARDGQVVFFQLPPFAFGAPDGTAPAFGRHNLRKTWRRTSFLLSRLLANLGVAGSTPLLERFHQPAAAGQTERRWLEGLYLDTPEEWDDPYRFFRW